MFVAQVCAKEREVCKCNGKVKFGVDDKWTNEKEVEGSIECTTKEFGDPAKTVTKECRCTPTGQ